MGRTKNQVLSAAVSRINWGFWLVALALMLGAALLLVLSWKRATAAASGAEARMSNPAG